MVTRTSGRVSIWWGSPGELARNCHALHWNHLSEAERTSIDRFVFAEDRNASLLARVMVRHVLTEMTGALPAHAWQFSRTPLGRPTIANPGFESLRFSISHTRSLVVCAVAAQGELGVDIESLERQVPIELADHYFTSEEAEDVRSTPAVRRARRFLEYWTLKEALLKARGLGLMVPLESFSFHFGDQNQVEVAFSDVPPLASEDPARWRFHSGEIAPSHVLAVACAPTGGEPLEVRFQAVGPLLLGGIPC